MAEFDINLQGVKNTRRDQADLADQINAIKKSLSNIRNDLELSGGGAWSVKRAIDRITYLLSGLSGDANELEEVLSQITSIYERTEAEIVGSAKNRTAMQKVLDKLTDTYRNIQDFFSGLKRDFFEFAGDPVNVCNGNYVSEINELYLDGLYPIDLKRYYNSVSVHRGAMGNGWSHSYEISMTKNEDQLEIYWGDGRKEVYEKLESGEYANIYGGTDHVKNEEGKYCHYSEDNEKTWFLESGLIEKCENAQGNCLLFYHDEDGRLAKIENESAAQIFFSYDEEGYLSAVEDSAGRKQSYVYEDGVLTEVTDVEDSHIQYTYDEDRRVSAITNSRGIVSLQNEYDGDGRVLRQKFSDGSEMRYEYLDAENCIDFIERNGNVISYLHDEKFRHVATEYLNGTEHYTYNDRNLRTSYTDRRGNTVRFTYDDRGNVTSVIDALGNKRSFTYDAAGNLISVRDPLNNQTKFSYDDRGNMIKSVDASGNVTEMTYDEKGKLIHTVYPDHSQMAVEYDERGNVAKITDVDGSVTQYGYDELNRAVEVIDGRGSRTAFSYDKKDRIVQVVNAAGQKREYVYDAADNLVEFMDFDGYVQKWEYNDINMPSVYYDKLGRKQEQEYDVMWNVSREINSNGGESIYEYNELNQLARATNPLGAEREYYYDLNGNLVKEVLDGQVVAENEYDEANQLTRLLNKSGNPVRLTYDAAGNVTAIEDAEGHITYNEYDKEGNLTVQTDPQGNRLEIAYDEMQRAVSIKEKGGGVTEYSYYPGGRLKQVKNPDGTSTSFEYDANGNMIRETSGEGYEIAYTYDVLNRMTEMTSNRGQHKTMAYDAAGNVTSITDANGYETHFEYSPMGKLIQVTDALGNKTDYDYDAMDELVEIRQSDGSVVHRTVYERDRIGQIKKITDPLGNIQTFEYDSFGRVVLKVDEDGFPTEYAYTEDGSVSRVAYADGNTVQMEYDAMKRLVQVSDWTGQTHFDYDEASRISKVTDAMGRETSYEWGSMDKRTAMIYPDGTKVCYTYDEANRLKEMVYKNEKVIYHYGKNGRIQEKEYPNQVKTVYRYNSDGMLAELRHEDSQGTLDRYRYQYDAVGNKTAAEKFRRGAEQESGAYQYQYDGLGRLLEVRKDQKALRKYTYDAFGNRTHLEEEGRSITNQYNARNQLIQTEVEEGGRKAATQYEYDKRGNMVSQFQDGNKVTDYIFGPLNRLQAVKKPTGEEADYSYNGLLQRVSGRKNGRDIQYVLDLTRRYHNLIGSGEGEELDYYFWDEAPIAMQSKGEVQSYYLEDDLGSVTRLMDAGGQSEEIYGYDEFGHDIYGNQGKKQPFGYTGYQMEEPFGLYFAQARYYRADSGRFISADIEKGILSNPRSLNEYGYVWQNPLMYKDDDGEFVISSAIAIGCLSGAIVEGVWSGFSEVKRQKDGGAEKVDWGKVMWKSGVGAAKGAVEGGLAASTVGLGAKIAMNAATGVISSIADQTIEKGSIWQVSPTQVALEGAVNAGTTVLFESKKGKFVWDKVDDFAKGLIGKVSNKIGGTVNKGISRFTEFAFREYKDMGYKKLRDLPKAILKTVVDKYTPSSMVERLIEDNAVDSWIPKGLHKIVCPA